MKTYKDTSFCPHCQRETLHIIQDAEHPRDSSNDAETCTECNWFWTGLTGEYQPPSSESIDEFLKAADQPYDIPEHRMINLILLFDRMLQDKGRPYKNMVNEAKQYVNDALNGGYRTSSANILLMPEEDLIDLIKFIGGLHQDGFRSYKNMAEEVRKYIGSISP